MIYRDRFYSVMLAVFIPVSLIASLWMNLSWAQRRWAITLFFTVFGSIMLIGTGDGYVHQQAVENYYSKITLREFLLEMGQILTFQLTPSGAKDVYKHVISYLFGGLLDLPQLFFPFVATVYGYFFGGSMLFVLRNFNLAKANYVLIAFVGVFIFVKGVEGFYSVRTWTGLWMLVYGSLKYFETRRLRYAALMFAPLLVHVAFFILAIPAWIVLVFGSRPSIYASIFLISSVTTVLPVEDTTNVLSGTERGASQVQAYLVDEQKVALEEYENLEGSTIWYNAYRKAGLQRWAPTLLVFVLLFSGVYTRVMTPIQQHIFSIGLLTMALSNSTWFLFALHNRSFTVATVFLLAGFLMARLDPRTGDQFSRLPQYYRWGLHASILFFIPLIMFQISLVLDRSSVFLFGLPFVVWWDPELNMSLKQLLNALLGRS